MLRRLLPLLLAALILALPAAPASAKRIPFRVFAGTTDTKGDGVVAGNLVWRNRGRNLRVRGQIDDLCPADGFRTQAVFTLYYASGKVSRNYGGQSDGRGCKASALYFKVNSAVIDDGSRIYKVDVTVWEYDEEASLGGDGDKNTVTYMRPTY